MAKGLRMFSSWPEGRGSNPTERGGCSKGVKYVWLLAEEVGCSSPAERGGHG